MAPPLRALPFPAPLPRGVVFPPLPRVLRRLAWLGALLTEDHKMNACVSKRDPCLNKQGFNKYACVFQDNEQTTEKHRYSEQAVVTNRLL